MPFTTDDSSQHRRSQAFDALPSPAVLLDSAGVIVESNESWRLFARLNDAIPGTTDVGVNYLEVCSRAAADSDAAIAVGDGLREILSGERQYFGLEYPCSSPTEDRWFQLQASGAPVDDGAGAVLLHVNITARRLLEESLSLLADRDPLTGLPNRRAAVRFIETNLEAASAADRPLRLLVMDLDGFKAVNDALGHPAGDEVLVQLSARARHAIRDGDLLCRIGGDEFVLVCPDLSQAGADAMAERLRSVISAPFQIGSTTVAVGISIGIAASSAGTTVDDLLNDADEAMYRVKRAGNRGRSTAGVHSTR
ncbi:MAG TPA: GGDEF domain-containing protein [Acidimicrobiia bacterium]